MKALIYDGPEQLDYRDVADAVAGPGEVLIDVHACGICGSDMHAYLGHDARRPAPLILGHEVAGITQDGRRVTVNPLVTCGNCDACKRGQTNICPDRQIISMPPREGGFAEKLAMPEGNLITVPDDIPLHVASLAEPLACGWHGLRLGLESFDRPAAQVSCTVIGGGAIGVGAALAMRAMGGTQITLVEPNAARRARLQGMDQITVTDVDQAPPADIVVDAVGYAATRAQASGLTNPGGAIVHIGLGEAEGGLDIRRMTLQEIRFIGCYTYTAQDFVDTTAAIFDGRLGPFEWVDCAPLADGAACFADLRAGKIAAAKIVLKP